MTKRSIKNIAVLGSTGSIGRNTVEIVERHPDKFRIVGLTAGGNTELFIKQIKKYKPKIAAINKQSGHKEILKNVSTKSTKVLSGVQGIIEVAGMKESDMVVSSIVGSAGLLPTFTAIKNGKDIGLANKEVLVMAGDLVMKEARKNKIKIIPIDSEHSAISQVLAGEKKKDIKRIILTASGGPFRKLTKVDLKRVTPNEALIHPNWEMGKKITIDSSTMMNKGFEVIEAKWLFGIDGGNIDVLIHPQSIIHSMVEFVDSSVIAQLGLPDMKLPISYALNYPERVNSSLNCLDLTKINSLTFEKPDLEKFPCLKYAYNVLEKNDSHSAVLNASNEIAVHAFINGKINFFDIPETINRVKDKHTPFKIKKITDALKADCWGRETAKEIIPKFCKR